MQVIQRVRKAELKEKLEEVLRNRRFHSPLDAQPFSVEFEESHPAVLSPTSPILRLPPLEKGLPGKTHFVVRFHPSASFEDTASGYRTIGLRLPPYEFNGSLREQQRRFRILRTAGFNVPETRLFDFLLYPNYAAEKTLDQLYERELYGKKFHDKYLELLKRSGQQVPPFFRKPASLKELAKAKKGRVLLISDATEGGKFRLEEALGFDFGKLENGEELRRELEEKVEKLRSGFKAGSDKYQVYINEALAKHEGLNPIDEIKKMFFVKYHPAKKTGELLIGDVDHVWMRKAK